MAETVLELRAILDAAERAAAAEDFVSAEQHLRQAALLQEQQLGAGHPDLANTLNNLGIVCEYVGKPADAEASYRRAYRIASATLPAEHPLVQTSGKNLRDFCEAIGKPVDLLEAASPELDLFAPEPVIAEPRPKLSAVPPPAPAPPTPIAPAPIVAPAAVQAPAAPAPAKQPPAKPLPATQPSAAKPPAASAAPSLVIRELPLRSADDSGLQTPARSETATIRISSPVSPSSSRHTLAIASGVVVIVAAATWWFGFREASGPVAPASPPVETAAPRQEQAALPEERTTPRAEPPPPVEAAAPEAPAVPAPIEKPPIAEAPAKPAPPPPSPSGTGAASVVEAKLCRSLSTSSWACTPATTPVAPGGLFFYTRVRSARDTTVQHRWSVDGRVVRSVSLRIGANPGAGYRTYSRNTVSAERRGNWTIELRGADGALLHEERFTVQ